MKEYFKLTGKKVLGVIIMLFLFSFVGFFLQYVANPTGFTGDFSFPIGLPLPYLYIGTKIGIFNSLYETIINLVIDIVIFYLITVALAMIFRRRKVENVPNSNSGGRDTSTPNQAQPQH